VVVLQHRAIVVEHSLGVDKGVGRGSEREGREGWREGREEGEM